MNPAHTIRQIREDELPQLIQLMALHAAYEQSPFNPGNKVEPLRQAIFSNPPKLHCLVVAAQDQLLGYLTYTFDYSTWDAAPYLHMDCLYLLEETRNQGIGAYLMAMLRDIASQHQCTCIQWQTPPFNTAAIRFYLRHNAIPKDKVRFTLRLP